MRTRRAVHRRLCARAGRSARQLSRHDPLGEPLGAARGVSARADLSDQVFSIDRDRYTCSGGTAPLDLMLNLIQVKLGPQVSQRVSEQFVSSACATAGPAVRPAARPGRRLASQPDRGRRAHGREHREPAVARARSRAQTGLSRRQIERLFKRISTACRSATTWRCACSRARELLLQTSMPIMDITHLLRLPVAAAFLEVLPQSFRPPTQRRAQARRGSIAG